MFTVSPVGGLSVKQGHHRVKQVALPEPFGSRRVLGFAEPDGGWLGPMADGLTVSPYICLPCQLHAAQKSQFGVTTTVTK
ncbi:hypothetical protein [Trebonia sp.]|uniref:hypothetical protein n=2 Tax=Trebonia sp. TaxID=2767075 RepID=UPI003CC69E8F